MDYHLDTKIVLSEDVEHKNLYKWFLREVGEQERKYQRDQIPWHWTQYFAVSELRLMSSFKLGDRYSKKEDGEPPQVKESDFIRVKLTPNVAGDERIHNDTCYSMFGTNRTITQFELAIYPAEEGKGEGCSVWGGVSYTTDIEFRDVTSPDCLTFYLVLSTERFARIVRMMADKAITGGSLRVNGVDGFYSDWSPGISTDEIKILTNDEKYHAVEIPDGCEIIPPRLGNIGELELYLYDDHKINVPVDREIDDNLDDSSDPIVSTSQGSAPQLAPIIDPKMLAVLKNMLIAAWVIAALLFAILVK